MFRYLFIAPRAKEDGHETNRRLHSHRGCRRESWQSSLSNSWHTGELVTPEAVKGCG